MREPPETLVPTLGVGTHVATLCVESGTGRDAERPSLRSHAERGNEVLHLCSTRGLPLDGRRLAGFHKLLEAAQVFADKTFGIFAEEPGDQRACLARGRVVLEHHADFGAAMRWR